MSENYPGLTKEAEEVLLELAGNFDMQLCILAIAFAQVEDPNTNIAEPHHVRKAYDSLLTSSPRSAIKAIILVIGSILFGLFLQHMISFMQVGGPDLSSLHVAIGIIGFGAMCWGSTEIKRWRFDLGA